MKAFIYKALMSGAVIATLTACGGQSGHQNVDTKELIQANQKTMDAETLADAAEQLVSPYTFMLADKVADMALSKDPKNLKARFYKAFLKRAMVMKGILKRVRPFAQTYGDIAQLDQNIKNFPNSPLRDFLLDGNEDIKTYSDIQDVLVKYAQAVNDFRIFLKNNEDMDLTLKLNPYVFEQQLKEDAVKNCVVEQNDSENVSVQCDLRDIAIKKLNSGDAVALEQMEAGEVLYYALYTSYSVEGIERILPKNGAENTLSPQEQMSLIQSAPNLGRLRKDQTISLMTSLGADFSVAAKWAMKYQSNLCPKGYGVQGQRKKQLFANGICIRDMSEMQRTVTLLDQALRGVINVNLLDGNNQERSADVNPFAIAKNPVQDLRLLMPNNFNACGKATSLKDKTLGGLFPNGDAEVFVLGDSRCE